MSFTGPQKLLISYGDYVLFYINPKEIIPIIITKSQSTVLRVGKFNHDEIVGLEFGKKLLASNNTGFVHLLHPTPELWTVVLPHRTQILYRPDISLIMMRLGIKEGIKMVEAGTGSGSFSHSISRSIGDGVLYSYEYHLERQLKAQQEFKEHKLDNIQSFHRDICVDGIHLTNTITAIFLDLPSPWLAINHPSFNKAFRNDRISRICSFSPSIEQVNATCKALDGQGWTDIKMFEVLAMEHTIVRAQAPALPRDKDAFGKGKRAIDGETKNSQEIIGSRVGYVRGHTSYLTFATLLPRIEDEGTVTIGPFHPSFTSVVGPNGSGKSNVIDSLLFVFGFKAKKLRQSKLADLIHKSKNFPDLRTCQLIPGSEFVISRSVKKSEGGKESSTYSIDDRVSSYTEVQKLLMSYGVDLEHKRFLILQGEVESIALMKPKGGNGEDGLLEYLEDIIGTTKYAPQIASATTLYDTACTHYDDSLLKFKHAQKQVEELREKSEDAVGYIEWENDCTRAKNLVLRLKMFQGEKDSQGLTVSLQEDKKVLEDLEKGQENEVQIVKELEVEVDKVKESLKSFTTQQSALTKSLSALEKSEVEEKEKTKFLITKKKKLVKNLADDKHSRSEDSTWISNFQSDLVKSRQELQVLKDRLVGEENLLEEIQASLGDKTQHFQTQIESRQKDLAPHQEIINSLEAKISITKSEMELFENKRVDAQNALEECLKRVNDVRVKMKTRKQERVDALTEVEELTAKLGNYQKRSDELTASLQTEREECKKVKVRYEDAVQTQGNSQSRGKVINFLNSLKSSLPGICGRLGDLGSIAPKYDTAITTACSQLDSIVVDDVATAQECIQQLKVTGIGRANFICLDKIKEISKGPIPSGSTRLFDLIKTEEKYAKAFYQAITETLVTKTIDEANKLAYGAKRFRVVTESGELIEKTGTMSGGGRVMKGGMGSGVVFSKEEIEEIKRELEERTAKVIGLEEELEKLVEKIERNDGRLGELKKLVSRLELDLTSYNEEKKDAKEAFEAAQAACQVDTGDSAREAELKVELDGLLASLVEPKRQAELIQDEIKGLQNEIMEVGGVRLRSQHGKVDSLNDQIGSMQKKLVKLVAEKETREKNLEKSLKTIERREAEVEEVEKEIELVEEKAMEISKKSNGIKAEIATLVDEMETLEEKAATLKSELAEKTGEMNKARSKNVELKAKIAADSAALKSLTINLQKYKTELEGLKLEMTGFEEMDQDIPPLEEFTHEELDGMNLKKAVGDLEKLKTKFAGNSPNLAVLREYRQKMDIYKERSAVVEEAVKKRDEMKVEYDRLRKERLDTFMQGFNAISLKLKEMYQMITLGGNAELELVDSLDPFSEGVLFSVMPPKKSWKNIANLSGGEKTLSSLALVFALHHFKPTPLYVMDEIDAALDFRNVSIIANYIKQRTRNAQFVIISLRNNMFELADRLVGIYKTDNTSKSISINPTEVEAAIKEEKLSHSMAEIAIAAE